MLIACYVGGDTYFFLAAALAWGGAAMHLRCHCFWRFSRPAPGQTYYNRIRSCSVCFNKSGYGPIVHSHIAPTYVFIFIAQYTELRQEQHLWVLFWAERGRHKRSIS